MEVSSIMLSIFSGGFHLQNYISPGSPAPSVTWWKDGSVFDDTFELVEKQNNGASNSTVIGGGGDGGRGRIYTDILTNR